MPQEMSVAELRRIAALHGGLTPESWLMDWAAGEIERMIGVLREIQDEAEHHLPASETPTISEGLAHTIYLMTMRALPNA
jgi:hypothetical protein